MLNWLRMFSGHLRGKGVLIAVMFVLGLAGAATSLATPLIGKSFIDSVVGMHDFTLVPRIALALLGLALADLFLGACSRLVHAKLSAGVLVELRERLFERCLHAPLADMERFRHGDLLSRFGSDIPKIQALLVDGLLGFFQNVLFLGVAAAILLQLSVPLALWSFLGLLLALVITTAFRTPVERLARVVREAIVDLSHFLSERLGGLRAIRLHAAQEADGAAFAAHNKILVGTMLKFQMVDAAASGFPALALTASLAWIYFIGGGLIESGVISLGTFVAFILYQGKLVGPAMGLLGLVRNIQEVWVSLERVAEVLALSEAVVGPVGGAGQGIITMDRVEFAYDRERPVLDQLDLRVAAGERVALFGSSGSGKSTLVQMLFGLRSPHRGTVTVGPASNGSHLLGYAGCEPFLLHATVADNLRYGNGEVSDDRLRMAAVLAEADRFISLLPQGYDTVIGGRGLALSDGQRQRIGLARLILRDPGILVLDEALSAVDPATERKIWSNLFSHFHDRTFVVISHRLDFLHGFHRLYRMEEGQLHPVDLHGEGAVHDDTPAQGAKLVLLDRVRPARRVSGGQP